MTLPSFDTKKQTTLNFEDSCKHLSNSTMQSIMPSDTRIAIDKSFEVSTSQFMPLGTHILSLGEPSEQARTMPTCALVNQDCKLTRLVTQVDIEPNSKDIITSEKYPPLEVVEQAPQEVNTYINFGVVENESKSYFMFASDSPSMIDTCSPLQ